jgi:hypothetical protein
MAIEILPASINDKSLIQKMMELYQYDFSEFTETDLDEHGYFGYSHLDNYWVETNRYPFLVRVDGQLAGFALVNQSWKTMDGRALFGVLTTNHNRIARYEHHRM